MGVPAAAGALPLAPGERVSWTSTVTARWSMVLAGALIVAGAAMAVFSGSAWTARPLALVGLLLMAFSSVRARAA